MTLTNGVGTRKSYDVTISESLGMEDFTQVIDALITIGETSGLGLDGFGRGGGVLASVASFDGGTAHVLDGDVGGESPEVSVGDEALVGVFFGDGLEEGEADGWETCYNVRREI